MDRFLHDMDLRHERVNVWQGSEYASNHIQLLFIDILTHFSPVLHFI